MNTHKHARLTYARLLEMVKQITEDGPNYKKICQRLAALTPDASKGAVEASGITDYQQMHPSCKNTLGVNNSYANMKDWVQRLDFMDSCVRQ